jgi:dihydropteroate synthase
MFGQVAEAGAGICLMHMRGDPRTMQQAPEYADVVTEVEAYLLERAEAAKRAGIAPDRILIDPGIGFGKTLAHNLALLGATARLASHGYPLLLGVSRKSFLGLVTGRGVAERRSATLAAVALGAREGAAVVRVHDVPECFDAVRVAAAWPRRSL